jgi:hypothetical protein
VCVSIHTEPCIPCSEPPILNAESQPSSIKPQTPNPTRDALGQWRGVYPKPQPLIPEPHTLHATGVPLPYAPPLGPPLGPTHIPTVRSWGGGGSSERGAPVGGRAECRRAGAPRHHLRHYGCAKTHIRQSWVKIRYIQGSHGQKYGIYKTVMGENAARIRQLWVKVRQESVGGWAGAPQHHFRHHGCVPATKSPRHTRQSIPHVRQSRPF